jgi:hypothetical protein
MRKKGGPLRLCQDGRQKTDCLAAYADRKVVTGHVGTNNHSQ